MDEFVLDCSMTMAWCFDDEATPSSISLLRSMKSGRAAHVPSIWPLEVANVLLIAERRKRIQSNDVRQMISFLERLPIRVDTLRAHQIFSDVLTLAQEQTLSSYDATYLELAVRETLPLATLDKKLKAAAQKLGVRLIE
ncbi:MAG: VapC toxin family PIN domain ribonuclease [Candidatus Omnitrophota bacterium]|jgi:predicted nucleic acid-binding protein|nr:MAG: VapC toxin family PIN domain ribonuclease [Candidatus Omnitrophota bacterium]